MKKIKIIYWIATLLFAGLMIFSAVGGIKPNEETIKILHEGLGYPIYFIQFISIAKLIGSIAILIPGLNRIKEWAYAGLFFDLAGAVYSGFAVSGAFDPMMLTLLAWIVPGIVSYIYFHKLKAVQITTNSQLKIITMSFQAYIDNIKAKTGKTTEDFKKLATKKGLLKEGVKAGEIIKWLKEDFDLGHGHAMAIYATFKGKIK